MNYECNVEFNIPTKLRNDVGFSQRMKESQEAYNYQTDFQPMALCMMDKVALQGQQFGTRGAPPQLMDVEWELRRGGIVQKLNEYIVADQDEMPQLPDVLKKKLLIPKCSDVFTSQRTRTKKSEKPRSASNNPSTHSGDRLNTSYMRPGIDTRLQIKDLYKEWDTKNAQNSDQYGLAKYGSRALVPGTNPSCHTGEINEPGFPCLHVYGPDAKNDGKIIDQMVPYPIASLKLDAQSNKSKPVSEQTIKEAEGLIPSWTELYKQTIDQKDLPLF